MIPVDCTNCGYCMPCEQGVSIPTIFRIYNEASMYEDMRTGRFRYCGPDGLKEERRVDKCTECNDCIEACPQGLDIPELLKEAHAALGFKD